MSRELEEAQVLAAVCELTGGDAAKARDWYEREHLPAFDGATAKQLVAAGRAKDVLRLLEIYDAGPAG
jgi:hypothetical protein